MLDMIVKKSTLKTINNIEQLVVVPLGSWRGAAELDGSATSEESIYRDLQAFAHTFTACSLLQPLCMYGVKPGENHRSTSWIPSAVFRSTILISVSSILCFSDKVTRQRQV